MPSAAHLRDDAEHLAHDQRRQPLRWLVQDQQPRIEQQRAGDRQHLLLAAGKLPAAVLLALGEPREQLVDARDGPRAGPLQRHAQVFLHRQVGEDAPPLRHVADAEGGDAERRQARGLLAEHPHTCRERSGVRPIRLLSVVVLPAPLRPSSAVILPSARDQADVVQDVALAVVGVQALGLQRVHCAPSPDRRPAPPGCRRSPAACRRPACCPRPAR